MMVTRATNAGHIPPIAAMHGQGRRCVVCDVILRPAAGAPDPYPICHAIACRMVVSRRDDMGETPFRYFLERHVQQRQALAATAAAVADRRANEDAQNTRVWSLLETFARLPAAPLQLVVPSGPAREHRLGRGRRARYLAHLQALAHLAAALPRGGPANNNEVDASAPSSLPGRLCGLCGGGCCTLGSDHAYLSPLILRRFMNAQPQLSIAEVVMAYMDCMPAAPRIGSCINHTRTGCSLPRSMRSDICNDFACAALAHLQAAKQGQVAVQVVLVVRRKQDQWQRDRPDLDNAVNGAAVLRETGMRRMPMG